MQDTSISDNKFLPHLLGVSILVAFLLPHTSAVMMLANPLLCVLLVIANKERTNYKEWYIVVIPILLSFIFSVNLDITYKALERIAVILLYFICFPFVSKVKLSNVYLYICLSVIIVSQLAYLLNIPFVTSFLDTYYPIPEELEKSIGYIQGGITRETIMEYRLGGLYRGVNPCARFLNMLLALYLINNSNKNIKKLIPFIVINFYGVLLTGSRSGYVVDVLLIISTIYISGNLSKRWKKFLILGGAIAFVYTLFSESSDYRAFKVFDGFNDSASEKSSIFSDYLSNETSLIAYFFGHFDTNGTFFDSDYGYITYSFGFVGFIAILYYFYTIFRKIDKIGRIFFFILLWMYSATIVMSYRPLFAFMLLLSTIYQNHKIHTSKGVFSKNEPNDSY